MKQLLIRCLVTREPKPLYEADEACTLNLWMPLDLDDGTENPPIRISTELNERDAWGGVPMNSGDSIPVYMEKGQKLWAISDQESLLGISAIPENK